jgi:hypothetical protein
MDKVSQKSVVRNGFKRMVVLGLGLTVAAGFAPVTSWAGFQGSAKQTSHVNTQSQDSNGHLMRVSAGKRIIMARGGNRSGGDGMGQRGGGSSESGYKYGSGDGTGTGERLRDGSGNGAKKGGGTGSGDRDGTGQGKGRGNQTN